MWLHITPGCSTSSWCGLAVGYLHQGVVLPVVLGIGLLGGDSELGALGRFR